MGEIHVAHARHLAAQQRERVGFAEQADRVPNLGAGQDRLEHRRRAAMDAPHMHDRPRRHRRVVPGHLGERAFGRQLARDHLAFERPHRVGGHLDVGFRAGHELERRPVELARDAELVAVDRRGFGRRCRGEMQARADAAIERDPEAAPQAPGPLEIGLEMPAGVDVDVQRVAVDDLEALDRGVADAAFGILGDHHGGGQIRSGILQRVHRHRDLAEIDVAFGDLEHGAGFHHRGFDRIALPFRDAVGDVLRQRALVFAHQFGEQSAIPVEAGEDGPAMTLHLLEQHGLAPAFEVRGDAGEFVARVHFRAHTREPAAGVDIRDDRGEVVEMIAGHVRVPLPRWRAHAARPAGEA